jgi:hypothetical protein
MTTIIKQLNGMPFDSNGNATLVVPNGTVIIDLKFYENAPHDVGQVISVVGLIDDPQRIPGTHDRLFTMIPDGEPIPATFKKYIATVPFGPQKVIVHVIEIFS